MTLGSYFQESNMLKLFDPSISYFTSSFCFVTPLGVPYNSLEIFFRPFKLDVWIYIIHVTVVVVVLYFIVKLSNSAATPNFSFVDFIRIYLGISVRRLPDIKYFRYSIMLCIYGAVVVRHLYQASVYKFLSHPNIMKIETIDDMLNANLIFYLPEQAIFLFDIIPQIKSR